MNNVSLVGNLATEPELKATNNGTTRCSFVVAVNEKVGEEEKAHFVRVTAFGTLAENAAGSLTKGQRVLVVGRINTYVTEVELSDGNIRRITSVTFTASAVGPDLRWQRAKISKVIRDDNAQDDTPPPVKRKASPAAEADEDDEIPTIRPKASSTATKVRRAAPKPVPVGAPEVDDAESPFDF